MRRTMRRLCADGQFDDASVEVIALGPAAGSGGGFDRFQLHQLAFRLGDDFVFDDQDVALAEFVLMLQGVEKQSGEGVAGFDLGFDGKRDDAEFRAAE